MLYSLLAKLCHFVPCEAARSLVIQSISAKQHIKYVSVAKLEESNEAEIEADCFWQVMDADQAAFPDFLTKMLPCMDAGVESDNLALVQSPQVVLSSCENFDVLHVLSAVSQA